MLTEVRGRESDVARMKTWELDCVRSYDIIHSVILA